jgi:hypothetical protein
VFCKWFCTPVCTLICIGIWFISAIFILFPIRPRALTSHNPSATCPPFFPTPLLPYLFACSCLGQTTVGFY